MTALQVARGAVFDTLTEIAPDGTLRGAGNAWQQTRPRLEFCSA